MAHESGPKSRPGGELQSFALDEGTVHETRLEGRELARGRPESLGPGAMGRLLSDPLTRGRIRDFDPGWSGERSVAWCEADRRRYLESRLDTWQLESRRVEERRWYELDAPPFAPDDPLLPDKPDGPSTEPDWIEVQLLEPVDGELAPVSGASVEVRDSMGDVHDGSTNAQGVARIDSLARGNTVIKFPDYDKGDWRSDGFTPGKDAFETFLDWRVVDEDGNQAMSGRYEVELPEGGKLEGELEDGRVRVDELDVPGRAKVSLFDVVFAALDPDGPDGPIGDDDDTHFIDVLVEGPAGQVAVSGRYELDLPDGTMVEGELIGSRVLVEALEVPGAGEIRLFDLVFEKGGSDDGGGTSDPDGDDANVPVDDGAASETKNAIDVQLVDHAGEPLVGVQVRILLEDGRQFDEESDEKGRVYLELPESDPLAYQVFFSGLREAT